MDLVPAWPWLHLPFGAYAYHYGACACEDEQGL